MTKQTQKTNQNKKQNKTKQNKTKHCTKQTESETKLKQEQTGTHKMPLFHLRLLTQCFILVGTAMFGAHGYTCWTTMTFVTLKDSSLKFNNLPWINYFSNRNVLQNGAKSSSLCQKHHNFVHFGPFDLVQILPACG